jgi:uncharacterized protein
MTPLTALRFQHPDLDARDAVPGLVISSKGGLALVSGDEAVRQSLMMLLSTVPGERVMRPDYGCPLHRLVFWPNDDTTAGLAMHYVRRAVERFEPRVELLHVDAAAGTDRPTHLELALAYRVRSSATVADLEITLDLQGTN